jgi:hypothetical protein
MTTQRKRGIKLVVSKETLRRLSSGDLGQVAGGGTVTTCGMGQTNASCAASCYCTVSNNTCGISC